MESKNAQLKPQKAEISGRQKQETRMRVISRKQLRYILI